MPRLSRRAALRLAGRVGLATVLGAGFGVPTSAGAAPARAAGGSFELLHPWNGDSGGARAMAALAKRYGELRPDVKLRQTVVAGGEYERKQAAAFASGRVPDLTLTFAELLPAYAARGALAALDDRAAADGVAMADYFDVVVTQSSWAGHLYGLTHHPDLRAVLYRNAALLASAGLDPDQPPVSLTGLADVGARLTRRDGDHVAAAGWLPTWAELPWLLLFTLANGASLLDPDGAHAAFDGPQVVEALQLALAATDRTVGLADPIVARAAFQGGPGQEGAYAAGQLGFAVGGSWYLDRVATKADLATNTRISLMPAGPSAPWDRISLASGVVQTIPKAAASADLAWDYARWVAGPEGQAIVQGASYDLPGLRAVARDPDAVAGHLFRADLVDALEHTITPAYLPTPVWPRLRAEIERVQQLAVFGQLTPRQAADELQARAQALLDADRAVGRALPGPPPAAASVPAPPTPSPANILRNPGFEGGSYRAGISNSVATDWSRWFQHRGADDPGYWLPEPEFGILADKPGQIHGGRQAHRWFTTWAVHNAGLYQTVAVAPGAWLRFSAFLFGWSSGQDQFGRSEGAHFRSVGIDPDGGADPFDPRVVWSAADATMDRWTPVSVVAQARRNRVTVFVRSQPDLALKHNDVLLDDAELVMTAPPADPVAALLAAGSVDGGAPDFAAALAAAPDVTRTPARGTLAGTPAGSHAYFWFDYPGGETLRRIAVRATVGSSRVDLQACKLEYSIVSPK